MGIFFNKNIKSLIEVKVNGQEMSYDDNKNKNTPLPAEDNKEEKPAEVEDNNPAPTEEPDKPEDEPVDDEPANDYRANFDDDTNADEPTVAEEDPDKPEDKPEDEPVDDKPANDYRANFDDDTNADNADEPTVAEEEPDKPEDEPVDDKPANDYRANFDDDTNADNAEGEEDPDKPEDEPVDDEPANDYRANFDDDANADNAEGEEAPTDTATDDETSIDSEGGTDKSSELKDIEKELFKDLSPEQIQIRDKELKSKYLELYNTINDIITRTGNISKTSANSKLLNFITDKLFELKNLLFFYMENTYITKSYMENSVNYQQCLATLSMINKLFDEMRNKK